MKANKRKSDEWSKLLWLGLTCAAGASGYAAYATVQSTAPTATTSPTSQPSESEALEPPIEDSAMASIDDELRYAPTTRPSRPLPQHPAPATQGNVDAGKPVYEWQRLTTDWGGIRPTLEGKGISIQPSLEILFGKNFMGGAKVGGLDSAYLFNLNITLDTEKLSGWKGGTFFTNFRTQDGPGNEQDGAFQDTSDLSTGAITEVTEAWYQQTFFDGKLRAKAGKLDASTEFAAPENAGDFLNNSMGHSPTILDLPEDTDTAFGANVFYDPTDHLHFGLGAYDGSLQSDVNTGANGPASLFDGHGAFYIGEADYSWSLPHGRDGRIGVGLWHHTGTFDRFDGRSQSGATGPYLTLDQTLWRKNPDDDKDDRGIAMYLQYGYADSAISLATQHYGAGLVWKGLLPGRDDDQLGGAVSWVRFTDAPAAGLDFRDEVVCEAYYKIRALKWLSIKPDLQYIVHPGGVAGQHDALAFTLQMVADF